MCICNMLNYGICCLLEIVFSSSSHPFLLVKLFNRWVTFPFLIFCSSFLHQLNSHSQQEILNRIEPTIFEWTAKVKGSISAEHGLGFKKRNYIHFSKSDGAVGLMKQMKKLMDPNGILNPYKVLPDDN